MLFMLTAPRNRVPDLKHYKEELQLHVPGHTTEHQQKEYLMNLDGQHLNAEGTILHWSNSTRYGMVWRQDIYILSYHRDKVHIGAQQDRVDDYVLPITRTARYHKSFIPATCKQWNQLNEDIKCKPTVNSFKAALKKKYYVTQAQALLIW